MVINHLSDDDAGYMRGIDSSVGEPRQRIVVWREHEPIGPPEVHCELAGTVPSERVTFARKCVHVLERWGVEQERQPPLEVLPVAAESTFPCPFLGTGLFELLVRPNDFYDAVLAQSITLGVIV
jgi:hypothetical protein